MEKEFKDACDTINFEMNNMTFMEYFDFIRYEVNPLFSIHADYLSVSDSLNEINKWINFQFGVNGPQFVQAIFDILTKKRKKNSVLLWGTPNSGKTFFTAALCDLFINVGRLGPINNRFSLAPLANARVCFWDEVQFSNEYTNTIKTLLSDSHIQIERKNIDIITRPSLPVFMCSNHGDKVFDLNDKVWTSRMFVFKTKALTYSLLEKQLHPLAFLDFTI